MKILLAVVGMLFAVSCWADDHRAALREANAVFTAAFEKCEDAATIKERNKCRGVAKAQHTKAVEKADRAGAKKKVGTAAPMIIAGHQTHGSHQTHGGWFDIFRGFFS